MLGERFCIAAVVLYFHSRALSRSQFQFASLSLFTYLLCNLHLYWAKTSVSLLDCFNVERGCCFAICLVFVYLYGRDRVYVSVRELFVCAFTSPSIRHNSIHRAPVDLISMCKITHAVQLTSSINVFVIDFISPHFDWEKNYRPYSTCASNRHRTLCCANLNDWIQAIYNYELRFL